MGQFSTELARAGYAVTVLTQAFPGRTSDEFHGVTIVSADPRRFPQDIRAAVASGDHDCCILVQDPLGTIIWSVEGLTQPAGTRLLIQPIINEDGYSKWKGNPDFRTRLAKILGAADGALVMTKSGPDSQFMKSAGLDPIYLPNATVQVEAAGDFRARFGIPRETFLVLHVANLYWVKNHVGLIDALPALPPSWKVVMIGHSSGESDCAEAVQAKLEERPEILFIPGLPREWAAAAMREADVVVLASLGEGSPITILEAMSHRRPWLATPTCGATNDHVGGIICGLDTFRAHLEVLANDPQLRDALGDISYGHWQQCYSWPVAIRGWIDLIKHGRLLHEFEPSAELRGRMARASAQVEAALQALPADYLGAPVAPPHIGCLLDRPGDPAEPAVRALATALAADFRFTLLFRNEQPDLAEAGLDLLVDFADASPAPTPGERRVRARELRPEPVPDRDGWLSGPELDLSVFHIDSYRSGPIRFGWVGNVGAAEVHEMLIPAMGDAFQVAIASETMPARDLAVFFHVVDVLLVCTDLPRAAERVLQAMACGVFPLVVGGGAVGAAIEHLRQGYVVERTPEAFRAAMQWCTEHGAEVRTIGYRNGQWVANRQPWQPAPATWRKALRRALAGAYSPR